MGTLDSCKSQSYDIIGLSEIDGDLGIFLSKTGVEDCAFFIDTSVLLAATSPRDSQKRVDAINFLEYLQKAMEDEAIECYTSPTVMEECFFKLIQWCYIRSAKYPPKLNGESLDESLKAGIEELSYEAARGTRWDTLYKKFPQLISLKCCESLYEFYRTVREGFGIYPLEPMLNPRNNELEVSPLTSLMLKFTCEFNLLPLDSLNLAISHIYGVHNVVTFDSDLVRASSLFRIFTRDTIRDHCQEI